MLEHKRIIIRRCRSGSRMAAGWTRRGVCTVERIRRSFTRWRGWATLSCTWPVFVWPQRFGGTAGEEGVCVCVHAGQCTQPVTFALISYSYACANASAIRAAPGIGRVFSAARYPLGGWKGISNGVWMVCRWMDTGINPYNTCGPFILEDVDDRVNYLKFRAERACREWVIKYT